jgi:hypothetical protein
MKIIYFMFAMLLFSVTACGQQTKTNKSETQQNSITEKKNNKMDLSKVTNPQVRKAVEAQINNDKAAWFALFTNNVTFSDDGNTLDFKPFFENAFNHKEKFLSIEKVANEGKDIYGQFDAGQWGIFNVFFKFHQNTDGKFDRLEIGANK